MRIRAWGTRGSLTTPGADTIKYGGNTTCLEVRLDDGTLIIIDAGSGMRALGDSVIDGFVQTCLNRTRHRGAVIITPA